VTTGATVTLRYEATTRMTSRPSSSGRSRSARATYRWSPGAPLGQALLGHGEGDVVDYKAPGGPLRVQIVKVEA